MFFISLYFYSPPEQNGPLREDSYTLPSQSEEELDLPDQMTDATNHPKEGLANYIDKPVKHLLKDFGEPMRKDPSAYGYEWWIYNEEESTYMQVGVEDKTVVTLYALGNELHISPYMIGQSVEDIYRSTLMETEIVIHSEEGMYRFELSEQDLNVRPLIQLGSIYAQLTVDKFTGTLVSVRFFNKDTLVSHRPYELVYRGKLNDPKEPSEKEWRLIEKGNERQIFDITNIVRKRYNKLPVTWDEKVSHVASGHSKDMKENNYFAHDSPQYGDLSKRLQIEGVQFQKAGENIALDYIDGPAAVEGWLNSEGHRKALLDQEFTHLGVGVYEKYYTQNFLKP